MLRQALILKVFEGASRSRRDCGNLEAVLFSFFVSFHLYAAVAATAAILRRSEMTPTTQRGKAAVAATAAILRRLSNGRKPFLVNGRSRRDCGNLEAEHIRQDCF